MGTSGQAKIWKNTLTFFEKGLDFFTRSVVSIFLFGSGDAYKKSRGVFLFKHRDLYYI